MNYATISYTTFTGGFGAYGAPAASSSTAAPAPAYQAPGGDGSNKVADNNVTPDKNSDGSGSKDESSTGSASAGTGPGQYSGKAANNRGPLTSSGGGHSGATDSEYVGNIGSPYGHNFALVDSAGSNEYTANLKNTGGSKKRIIVFNKIGQDGSKMTGFIPAANPPAIDIELGPNESQMVAIGGNSQGAMCDWTDGKVADKSGASGQAAGAYDCAWGEFNFGDKNNMYGSNSWDVSMIQSIEFGSGGGDCGIKMTNSDDPSMSASCTEHIYKTDANAAQNDATIPLNVNAGQPLHLDVEFS